MLTRINNDEGRQRIRLEQQTRQEQWWLDVPCAPPCFQNDPQIMLQKFGANLWSDPITISNQMRGITVPLNRDCKTSPLLSPHLTQSTFTHYPISYASCSSNDNMGMNGIINGMHSVEQSRFILPAYKLKDREMAIQQVYQPQPTTTTTENKNEQLIATFIPLTVRSDPMQHYENPFPSLREQATRLQYK